MDEALTRRRFMGGALAGVGGLLLGGLAACGDDDSSTGPGTSAGDAQSGDGGGDPVRIGLLLPMTGGAAAFGQASYDAIELVVEDINRNGGIGSLGGAPIELVLKDSQGTPEAGATEVQALVDSDVLVIIGAIQSAVSVVGTQIAERAGVPWVTCSDASSELTSRGFRYTFQPGPTSEETASDLVRYVTTLDPGPSRLWIMTEDAPVAAEIGVAVEAACADMGLDVAEYVQFPADRPDDVQPLLARAKREGVDLIIQHNFTPVNAVAIRRQMQEVQFDPLGIIGVFGGHGSAAYIAELGPLAENTIVGNLFTPHMEVPALQDANAAYEERTGRELDIASGNAYSSIGLVADALQRAAERDRDAVRDALSSTDLNLGESYWILPEGVRFDERGKGNRQVSIITQIKDGQHEAVAPEEFASATVTWPLPAS